MAKLYHKGTAKASEAPEPGTLLTAVETFLSTCRNPAVLEYGEEIMPLASGEYMLEIRSGRIWIEVWSETRSLSRQILTIEGNSVGVLDCTVQRFGGKAGKLSFLDLARPQTAHRSLCGERLSFTEQFRRMLFRQFPGWEISTLSCGMDLQRSFSSIFPRARISRGNRQIAAMACPSAQDESAMLTSALIWHHHVSTHGRNGLHTSLCLFLPDGSGNLTSHRLRWLAGESLETRLFRFNAHGSAGEVDPQDLGNLQTRVQAHPCHTGGVEELTATVSRRGCEAARHKLSERRLESSVRSNLTTVDPLLAMSPIHGQVLTFAAGDRDLIDLLAVSTTGRLAVLELKVSEDIHLPLQALDYWMRIAWHAGRGELQHLFPAKPLESRPPTLLLVAPAISFHSSNAIVLRYFSPGIEVERVGLNSDWQQHFKVVLRLKGAAAPISHGSSQ